MKKYLAKQDCIIVFTGKPYRLVREMEISNPNPCNLCGLSDVCMKWGDAPKLVELCCPEKLGDGWFFIEDYSLYNRKISDFAYCEDGTEEIEI